MSITIRIRIRLIVSTSTKVRVLIPLGRSTSSSDGFGSPRSPSLHEKPCAGEEQRDDDQDDGVRETEVRVPCEYEADGRVDYAYYDRRGSHVPVAFP